MITAGRLDEAIASLPPWPLALVVIATLAFLGFLAWLLGRD